MITEFLSNYIKALVGIVAFFLILFGIPSLVGYFWGVAAGIIAFIIVCILLSAFYVALLTMDI